MKFYKTDVDKILDIANQQEFARIKSKTGRNKKCPCGSQKKFKKCCLKRKNNGF